MLIGLTLQDMKQVTSVVSNITWGQELFRLDCYVEKSHGHNQLHLYVPITAKSANVLNPLTAERRIHFEEKFSNFINIGLNSDIFLYKIFKIKFVFVFREF